MAYEPTNSMDRGYSPVADIKPKEALEEPVLTLNQIGQTVVETDPVTGKNILQNVQAAIRAGAGNIQIVLSTSRKQPMGGGSKATGQEVREALKEVALANQTNLIGFELPTGAVTNLSGYDPQQRRIDEQAQKENLDEIREALQFAADLGGGEVDLVSFEFPRALFEQTWNKTIGETKDKNGHIVDQKTFEIPDEAVRDELRLVDVETGAIQALPRRRLPNPFFKYKNKETEFEKDTSGMDEKEVAKLNLQRYITWEDYLKEFKEKEEFKQKTVEVEKGQMEENPAYLNPKDWGDDLKVREAAFKLIREELFARELSQARSSIARTRSFLEGDQSKLASFQGKREKLNNPDAYRTELNQHLEGAEAQGDVHSINNIKESLAQLNDVSAAKRDTDIKIEQFDTNVKDYLKEIQQQQQSVAENERRKDNAQFFESHAREKAVEGYKKAGMIAYEEQKARGGKLKHSLQIGPELGWPQYFGGHPDEFIDIITSSRKEMEQDLVKEGVGAVQAKKSAEEHIKGIFDTGHLGMWLEHFRTDLPWEKRVKEFNTWYLEQVEKLAENNMISGVQAVDTATGAHAHLPPGQGILPIKDAVSILKKKGFNGPVVSEGHEEEKFGSGRILMKAWQHFDPKLRTQYGAPGVPFSQIHNSYVGGSYTPQYMVASVAPPFGEYRPWAGGDQPIPFE
ncbi:MAG: TIM barrel protein [Candidatus Woesearchaeota archaeon]|jgi:hypothetical protein|nr:TIM barrel protein [Candidatus Woesearchaeota archaeon]MDP7199064.1 TIM barrel protein [Candidatus Woesearchaeota archaeon]MDP7467774.1 TIM barrel protein [Candidatus Woesearchaeota archaeon]MDP7646477.1 TIM barrel protein [Candidatus Woesearchaeota archaeon]